MPMERRGFRHSLIVLFFYYRDITNGYKMIDNAVLVRLARVVAEQIAKDIDNSLNK